MIIRRRRTKIDKDKKTSGTLDWKKHLYFSESIVCPESVEALNICFVINNNQFMLEFCRERIES